MSIKITFVVKSSFTNEPTFLIYDIKELVDIDSELSSFFLLNDTYFQIFRETYVSHTVDTFRDFYQESFEYIINCIHSKGFIHLTSLDNLQDIINLCKALGLNKFIRDIAVDPVTLFEACLTDLDLYLYTSESKMRRELYTYEEEDFRNDDEKLLFSTVEPTIPEYKIGESTQLIFEDPRNSYITVTRTKTLTGEWDVQKNEALPIQVKVPILITDPATNMKIILGECPLELGNIAVIAGGAVNNCLTSSGEDLKVNDVDVFFITKNVAEAEKSLYHNLVRIINSSSNKLMVRTKNSITVEYSSGGRKLKIQFILRLYNSIAQVISGFDIDASCAAFNGENFYAIPRYIRAVKLGYIIADPERQSTTYMRRLFKYKERGFHIAFPGYNPERVVNIYKGVDFFVNKLLNDSYSNSLSSDYEGPFRTFDKEEMSTRYYHNLAYKHILKQHPEVFPIKFVTDNRGRQVRQNEKTTYKENLQIIKDNNFRVPLMVTKSITEIFTGHATEKELVAKRQERVINPLTHINQIYDKHANDPPDYQVMLKAALSDYLKRDDFKQAVIEYRTRDLNIPHTFDYHLQFKTRNPGTQFTNSFQPIFSNWFTDAYVFDEKIPHEEEDKKEEPMVSIHTHEINQFPPPNDLPIPYNYNLSPIEEFDEIGAILQPENLQKGFNIPASFIKDITDKY